MKRRPNECSSVNEALFLRIRMGCDAWVQTARQPKVMSPNIQEVENV